MISKQNATALPFVGFILYPCAYPNAIKFLSCGCQILYSRNSSTACCPAPKTSSALTAEASLQAVNHPLNSGASIDFGVLVCLNCSGAHRALGPSVTRVKSTKLDTWMSDWFEYMTCGNEACNLYWEGNIGLNKYTSVANIENQTATAPWTRSRSSCRRST